MLTAYRRARPGPHPRVELDMSLPCHQPEKWKGRKIIARRHALGDLRAHLSPRLGDSTPDVLAIAEARVVGVLRIHLGEHLLLRLSQPGVGQVSSPPPSYSTRRPEVMLSG